jgi:hypothetical protein
MVVALMILNHNNLKIGAWIYSELLFFELEYSEFCTQY